MAVHAAVAARASAPTLVRTEEISSRWAGDRELGHDPVSAGERPPLPSASGVPIGRRDPSIDAVCFLTEGSVGARAEAVDGPTIDSDVQTTGTLPARPGALGRLAEGGAPERPAWVEDARAGLGEPGRYLAYEEGGRRVVVPIAREWTRIGRSLAADVRFDDATVSRRHALVVSQADGRPGARRPLAQRRLRQRAAGRVEPAGRRRRDLVGRHTLCFLDTAVGAPAGAPPRQRAE